VDDCCERLGTASNRRNIIIQGDDRFVGERIELLEPVEGDRCDLVLDGIVDRLIRIGF
jgi:hypothetical protein